MKAKTGKHDEGKKKEKTESSDDEGDKKEEDDKKEGEKSQVMNCPLRLYHTWIYGRSKAKMLYLS